MRSDNGTGTPQTPENNSKKQTDSPSKSETTQNTQKSSANSATGTAESTAHAATSNGAACGAERLTQIYSLLGDDAVLLPVDGKKVPICKEWQKTTFEQSKTEEYRRLLSTSPAIGVALGKQSNGVCTIDIDSDEAVEPFIQLNQCLKTTVRSKGVRGEQFWFRINGEYPALAKLWTHDEEHWGEWRATGGQSVISGVHPSGVNYRFICEGPIVHIAFDQIVWPENLKLPWIKSEYDLLVEEEGPPFLVAENGGIIALNHTHFAVRYAREHTVLFDDTLKEFFGYEPCTGLWKRETLDTIKREISANIKKQAKDHGAPGLLAKRNETLINGIANILRTQVERRAAFQSRRTCIHVKNGVLRLDADPPVLESFSPEFYSRNQCPIAFEPDARCPRFLNELLLSALPREDVALLQKFSGAALLGENLAQRILLVTGTAGGGKSTLMNIIEAVIGRGNVANLRTNQLGERFELMSFDGKTLLTGKDVSAKFLMQKGAHVLKALVGHDYIEAEKKGSNERVQLYGNFNVAITCNTKLRVRLEGDTDAWRRRLMVVNYNKPKPEHRIANFAEMLLTEEGPGILSWMVEGAMLYLEEVQTHGDIVLSRTQRDRVDSILSESDSVRQFVESCIATDKDESVTSQELLVAYRDFCERMEWEGYPDSDVERQLPTVILETFNIRKRHDIERPGSKGLRGYRGISLNK